MPDMPEQSFTPQTNLVAPPPVTDAPQEVSEITVPNGRSPFRSLGRKKLQLLGLGLVVLLLPVLLYGLDQSLHLFSRATNVTTTPVAGCYYIPSPSGGEEILVCPAPTPPTPVTPPATPSASPRPTEPTTSPKPTSSPTATPKPTTYPTFSPRPTLKPTATPKPLKCTPRPSCLDAKPACRLIAPKGGWCPVAVPAPTVRPRN